MSKALQELSNELSTTVASAGASVVRVEGRRRTPASGIVWSADGLIVTANHVLRRDDRIMVGLPGGDAVEATLVGRDPSTDLAVLQVDNSGLTPLEQDDETEMTVGHLVMALGRPGRTIQATFGIVSGLGDGWSTPMGGQIDRYLQTDVVMYPGFSGGPLIGANGRLLGLNTSGIDAGVSLAIPPATLGRVVDSLRAHGRVRRGYLGVSTQRVRLPDDAAASLGQKTALLVISIDRKSVV